MNAPTKDYSYETPIEDRLIDSLKDKFSVEYMDNEYVNSFLCLNNDNIVYFRKFVPFGKFILGLLILVY